MKKTIFLILWLWLYFSLTRPQAYCQIQDLQPIRKHDRILVFAPHPDDETIGCLGIIQQALGVGADIHIVYLTNGEHNQFAFIVFEKRIPFRKSEFIHLGEVRRKEAIKAMELIGLSQDRLIFLGYPDAGTFLIFARYWQKELSYKNFLTRISNVPYPEDLSYGAPYKGENILADLERVIKEYRPTRIFVPHPADVNPDHKALYLFLQIALSDLKDTLAAPLVHPYLVHWVGWPLPRRYHPELSLSPPEDFSGSAGAWFKYDLTPEQLEVKRKAMLCYKSQTESSASYLLSFVRNDELFGDFPAIELQRQTSATEFFGDSGMFTDSDVANMSKLDDSPVNKGVVGYALTEESLLVRVAKIRGAGKKTGFNFYLFGYSYKTPFSHMPKMRILVRNRHIEALDDGRRVLADGIILKRDKDTLIVSVPLKLLGDPDFILSSVKTYAGFLPVNTSVFRRINIKK